ncbi:pharyngeal muscle protein 2 [Lutzomyia longipalpis]|uniref:pharyngeal muscle protein 2 n=1 Tax=Lutzomyia longipalpis TaxID=7200 RepID=UPI002483C97B|nr:pharyngeal muscle protein 2 [Lutzomyia longipalpis]
MMTVIDLKFSKFNDTPWGFRLTGGADFDFPLTVIKVTEGSLAAQAGMQLGDVVVRINDTPASNLTHLEAHNVLLAAGNNFMLGIQREIENVAPQVAAENPPTVAPQQTINEPIIEEPAEEAATEEKTMDIAVTDDQIAEVISSEAEVLKDHNVIGVNFNKIMPQAMALKTSEVFKTLNAEAVKTKEDKIQEERKWTTFLQKPNRPIPKSKWDIEQEKRVPYKVRIVKQPKPKIAPDRVPTPTPAQEEPTKNQPTEEAKTEEPTNHTEAEVEEAQQENNEEEEVNEEELVTSTADNEVPDLEEPHQEQPENPDEMPREVEEKLIEVQRQLMSLSNLPHAIKSTLDAVTEQLSKIVPIEKDEPEAEEAPQTEIQEEHVAEDERHHAAEDQEVSDICGENEEQQQHENQEVNNNESYHPDDQEIMDDIRKNIADKGQESEEEMEQQQRLIRDRTPKIPPKQKLTSAFGPLVPQERPIFLPGGRKWRKPKDAFNDEFIAEVLSSQAELIVGTTLGVNFLKYQKPEKKVDLSGSEVYRMIHCMDKVPAHGIAARPEKVFTAEDVHRSSSPLANCGQ